MTQLFITVVNMSIVASFTAILVIIARLLLKKLRLPTVFAYLLWAIVFIRLIIPFSFESNVSMVLSTNTIPYQFSSSPGIDSGITFIDQSVNTVIKSSLPAAQPVQSADPLDIVMYVAGVIWLAGFAILAGYAAFTYIRLYRKLCTATKVQGNIFESDRISAPFVMGLFKPKIYLPLGLSKEPLQHYIILHEQSHIRRLDHITKPIVFLITIIHWFNPFAWLSYKWMIKDMEMSCDERVMKTSKGDARKAYSYALLSMATTPSGFPRPISFGESDVKGRIRNIMNYKKPVFWIGSITAAILIIFSASLLFNPLQAMEPAGKYDQAWKYRTPYIGNASKVSNMSGGLPYPAPFKYDHIQLQTDKEPYGLTVYLAVDEQAAANKLTSAEQLTLAAPELQRNAMLLFGLIGNAGEIVFQVNDESEGNSVLFTREGAQARLEQPLFAATEAKDDFNDFAKKVDEWVVQDQVTDVVKSFGDVMKQVRIATVPIEQTEEMMDLYYAPYVTKGLMAKWKENIDLVPGRQLSSPWPERIDVVSIARAGEDGFQIKGDIVWMTSEGEVGNLGISVVLIIEDGQWKIDEFSETSA